MLTWHYLHVVCGVHRHHLRKDSDTISIVWVDRCGNLHKRQRWKNIGVEVLLDGVWSRVHVESICGRHNRVDVLSKSGFLKLIISYYDVLLYR